MTSETPMCPYLVPVVADRLWMVSTGAYCRRPDHRVRIPGRSSLADVCLTDGHRECPGFRETEEDDPGKDA